MMIGLKIILYICAIHCAISEKPDVNNIKVTAPGQCIKTNKVIKVLTIIGQKQCIRKCLQNGQCRSINYRRQQLHCELIAAVYGEPGASSALDSECDYIEMENQPKELAGPCNTTSCERQCTPLSNGKAFCIQDRRCPDNYTFNTTLYLCLASRAEALTWYEAGDFCNSEDGRTRLAVLDTRSKVEAALSLTRAPFTHYWIGATYSVAETQSSGKNVFYWNNGKKIDSTFMSQYTIHPRSGRCIFLYTLDDPVSFWADQCTDRWAAICEYIL